MLARWAVVVTAAAAVSATSRWSPLPLRLKDEGARNSRGPQSLPDFHIFHEMSTALADMQNTYFQRWIGTWPQGIDWTRAVMSTHVAATLRTISDELEARRPNDPIDCAVRKEEVIAGYFADVIAYYFGEDSFALRQQAYDDMLWVVLGWLESIQFVDGHGAILSGKTASSGPASTGGPEEWYGSRWTPVFAHRARVFWELAAKGWDTTLCGGGMLWNPRLMPYKNAITNQLFISASVSMYLHFPGDANASPFSPVSNASGASTARWDAHDPVFASAALRAYEWLSSSNMTNAHGLYADGFHVSGYGSGGNNTRCDQRDEMVYTYNQGVILSGLLGLFQATGRERYLHEGHALVRNVVRATGWDLDRNVPVDDPGRTRPGNQLPPWRGLGRAGVLEEACDVWGSCSQDGQTFKGIWMHHFATFCSPAALRFIHPDAGLDEPAAAEVRARHAGRCRRYIGWLRHNARAAMGTRDAKGLFGMWWTAGLLQLTSADVAELESKEYAVPPVDDDDASSVGDGGGGIVVDYRNFGVPRNSMWMRKAYDDGDDGDDDDIPRITQTRTPPQQTAGGQKPILRTTGQRLFGPGSSRAVPGERGASPDDGDAKAYDPNLRGRGRTLETQSGGLAVLRALWVVSKHEL